MASFGCSFPILPGKTDQWKSFNQEMAGPRLSEFVASCQRVGVTRQATYLQQTPHGNIVIVYIEGQDIPQAFQALGTSLEAFDIWYCRQVQEIHGVNLSQPLPGPAPEPFLDWRAS